MDKFLQDKLTSILSVAVPVIIGLIYQYQAEIMGYMAQYGPTSVAIVGAVLAVISAYYSKRAGVEKGKAEVMEIGVPKGEQSV